MWPSKAGGGHEEGGGGCAPELRAHLLLETRGEPASRGREGVSSAWGGNKMGGWGWISVGGRNQSRWQTETGTNMWGGVREAIYRTNEGTIACHISHLLPSK